MKKKINKNIVHLVLVAILSGYMSCEDYLSLTPPSSLDGEFVFSTVDNAKSAVMGVYHRLTYHNYSVYFVRDLPFTADDAMGSYNGTLENGMRSIHRYDIRSSNTIIETAFEGLYSGIERANTCIKFIPEMDLYQNGTEEQQASLRRLHGETLTLRAFFYLELIKNWGDVPATFEPSSYQKDLFLKKTKREDIYDRILDDLKEATELLPWVNDVADKDERITKGTALALRARTALFAGGYSLRVNREMERPANYLDYYEIAEEASSALLERRDQHTLNPDYENVFKLIVTNQRDPHGEILFEIGSSPTHTGIAGYFDGPRYFFPGDPQAGGSEQIFLLPTFFYAFDSLDVRRDVSVAPYRVYLDTKIKTGRGLSTLRNGKFRADWKTEIPVRGMYIGTNWPLIRFSDVLLMYAEAANEINNGPTQEAKDALEEVRSRAFKENEGAIGATPDSKEEFFEAIVNERLLEFGCEAIRKYDLIRWNMLAGKLYETKENLEKIRDRQPPYDNIPTDMYLKTESTELEWGNSFYSATLGTRPTGYASIPWQKAVGAAIIDGYAPFFEENHNELLPIPESSMRSNPNLTQDYGY